jgi:hypothetical protein
MVGSARERQNGSAVMQHGQDDGLSLFLVFGVIVIGAIALFTRIRDSRKRRDEGDGRSTDERSGPD